jgi:hypothetical protein
MAPPKAAHTHVTRQTGAAGDTIATAPRSGGERPIRRAIGPVAGGLAARRRWPGDVWDGADEGARDEPRARSAPRRRAGRLAGAASCWFRFPSVRRA